MGKSRTNVRGLAVALWPLLGLVVIVVAATYLVELFGDEYVKGLLVTNLVYLVLVVGLYVFVGNTGVFSFGHLAFAAVGAYTAGILVIPSETKSLLFDTMPGFLVDAHAAPIVATLIGGLVAAFFGLLTAIPIMRLSGLAASLATFALLIIVNVVAQNLTQVTNGQSGLTALAGDTSRETALVWALLTMISAYLFQRSSWGLRVRASREDYAAARASGIGVFFERRVAWIISAFYMGIGGALYGQLLGTVTPSAFYFNLTLIIVAMLVIGGRTSLAGAVIGTLFVATASELLRRLELGPDLGPIDVPSRAGTQAVGLGLCMLLALILRPAGLTGGRELAWPGRRLRRAKEPGDELDPASAGEGMGS